MYLWLVTLHVVGVFLFLVSHATSMWVAFRVRREQDRTVIAALLGLSARGNQVMYLGLLLLGIGGLGAAWNASLLTATWVVASYVVVIVTLVAMYAIGAGFYYPVRDGLEGTPKTPRLDDDALRVRLSTTRRPEVLAAVGGAALVVLAWLMVMKPT